MMSEQMSEAYRLEKIRQHDAYRAFLIVMMGACVVIGVTGIVGYFTSGSVVSTIVAAGGIVACIFAMLSPGIKSRIIYPIRGL